MARSKNSKKGGLLSRFSKLSKKGQILVTVAIFAVIGGGVFVYRSFAAVSPGFNSVTFSASNNWLKPSSTLYNNATIARAIKEVPEERKNRIIVFEVPTNRGLVAQSWPNGFWVPVNYYYQICVLSTATISSTQNKLLVKMPMSRVVGGPTSESVFVLGKPRNVGGGYNERCTAQLQNRKMGFGETFGPINFINLGPDIRVASITSKLGQRGFIVAD